MRLSIIIPHFNDWTRLERLLRSVAVARDDVEVIVVDDCSPGLHPTSFGTTANLSPLA
ncbi:MAG: hypothetical protein CMK02_05680 [Polycyclovorans sp.]|nr:hypothetical protein [Polycyclovorans sp.]